jgi:hypothetical protein
MLLSPLAATGPHRAHDGCGRELQRDQRRARQDLEPDAPHQGHARHLRGCAAHSGFSVRMPPALSRTRRRRRARPGSLRARNDVDARHAAHPRGRRDGCEQRRREAGRAQIVARACDAGCRLEAPGHARAPGIGTQVRLALSGVRARATRCSSCWQLRQYIQWRKHAKRVANVGISLSQIHSAQARRRASNTRDVCRLRGSVGGAFSGSAALQSCV